MPDETGLVEERGGLERGGGDADDVVGEEEEIGRDLAEIGVLFGEFGGGGGGGTDCGGVGEVDAGVPEAVAELPDVELDGVGEGREGGELSEAEAEVGEERLGEGGFRRVAFEVLDR